MSSCLVTIPIFFNMTKGSMPMHCTFGRISEPVSDLKSETVSCGDSCLCFCDPYYKIPPHVARPLFLILSKSTSKLP
ncbi:hypothetical protein ABKN59_011514 [Abortiporus biennis]